MIHPLKKYKSEAYMKYVYPAVFTKIDSGYGVKVPSLPGCVTSGADLAEAIEMARDAVEMWLAMAEDAGEQIPEAKQIDTSKLLENQFVSFIDADTQQYRIQNDNRAVKKTLTIPSWLNAKAEKANVNFSQILQSALKEYLGYSDKKGA